MSFKKLVQTLALHVISNWKRSNSSSTEAKSTSFFCGQFNLSQLHQDSSTSNQRCTSLEPTEIVWDCNLKWVEFSLFFPWIWSIGRSSLFVYLVLIAMQGYCMINNQYPFVKILNIQCLFKTRYHIDTTDTTFYID